MNKNFKFSERIKLEHHLNIRQDCSAIKLAKILGKSRSTIYYELKHFRSISSSKFERFNHTNDNWKCPNLQRFPFVCNGCVNTRCSHRNTFYNAYEADRKANQLLHRSRVNQKRRDEVIRILNRSICPLIKDGISIQVAMDSVNNCDLSEAEFYKTNLNGIDVSNSIVSNIKVPVTELRGLVVSVDQALSLSTLLGIKIK